jgi:lysophospholipase L1-like esterase
MIKLFVGFYLFASIVALLLYCGNYSWEWSVNSSDIWHDSGNAYTVRVSSPSFLSLPADGDKDANASPIRMFEDGRELGPAHQIHGEIRASGEGRFSHWGEYLWFSTPDNTDPRANGRQYQARARLSLSAALVWPLATVFALPGVIGCFVWVLWCSDYHLVGMFRNVSTVVFSIILSLVGMEGALRMAGGGAWSAPHLRGIFSDGGEAAANLPRPRFLSADAEAKLGARAAYLTLPDEWKRREVKPPRGARVAYTWHGALHIFDERSMRLAGPVPPKQPGVVRILVFGDSLTYGNGVDAAHAYPAVLQKALAVDHRVEVLNLGVSGHQSEDILKKMELLTKKLEGDIVIYGICHNDFLDSGEGQEEPRWRWKFPVSEQVEKWLRSRFRLAEFMSDSYDRILLTTGVRGDFYDVILQNMNGYRERFARDVRAMNNVVVKAGLPPVITVVLDQFPGMDRRGRELTRIAEDLTAMAGMHVVSTENYYRQYAKHGMGLSAWEGHPNEEAHAIFAELLYDELSHQGLLSDVRKN